MMQQDASQMGGDAHQANQLQVGQQGASAAHLNSQLLSQQLLSSQASQQGGLAPVAPVAPPVPDQFSASDYSTPPPGAAVSLHTGGIPLYHHHEPTHHHHHHSVHSGVELPQDLASRTLPGFLANYIRVQGGPVSEETLLQYVAPAYDELRKPDGTRYTGRMERAVRGTLASTGIFQKIEDEQHGLRWTLKEDQARLFEERLAAKAAKQEELRSERRRKREEEANQAGDDEHRAKRKQNANSGRRMRKGAKRDAVLAMLANFSEQLRDNPEFVAGYVNPCKGLKGTETVDEAIKKIGQEKFCTALAWYNYIEDFIVGSRHGTFLPGAPFGAFGRGPIDHFSQQMRQLTSRIASLEQSLIHAQSANPHLQSRVAMPMHGVPQLHQ
eukprot:TRINITY_DN11383_c0_g1::TRINITY_DN11383_c0_g1_i1::g.26446::m.26446 TRINITY_DN11383_c0_g1::TRINITY_DN11383_c0_g1_i1::g.26446  ORF type:complete len:384 (-),score=42.92 TRINITY_DN11383_c0_g1_i1:322-1473(-)